MECPTSASDVRSYIGRASTLFAGRYCYVNAGEAREATSGG